MGWTFQKGQSRAGLIADRVASWENAEHGTKAVCLAHTAKGNVLWTVWEHTGPKGVYRFIGCDLLGRQKGYGWGYKDMSESEHPYYYTCPLSYLGMVPEACPEWRALVREYHDRATRKLELGAVYSLPGCKPDRVRIVSLKPLRGEHGGIIYRISKTKLGDKIIEAQPTPNDLQYAQKD